MSTNLELSQWLDQVARRIEQECPECGGNGYLKYFNSPSPEDGSDDYECSNCHGFGRVRPYAESGVGGWLRAKKGRMIVYEHPLRRANDQGYGTERNQLPMRPHFTTILQRFMSHVEVTESCWLWMAQRSPLGYGRFYSGKPGTTVAHRWLWQELNVPLPQCLTIDHLCRNPSCVNPDHLDPVTQAINTWRGQNPMMLRHQSLRCSRGHLKIGLQRKDGHCRECRRIDSYG